MLTIVDGPSVLARPLQDLDELLGSWWQRPADPGENPDLASQHRLPDIDPADG
jgi:hypothetical protein